MAGVLDQVIRDLLDETDALEAVLRQVPFAQWEKETHAPGWAIRDQVAPPTLNLDNPSVATPLDLAPNTAVKRRIDVALSNSFGFGGTNASLVLRRPEPAAG